MATRSRPETPRGLQPPDKSPVRITVPEGKGKVRYGDAFWPKTPFQSIFYIAAIFASLIILALSNPAPLEHPADPLNHEAIDPKPEWYFMFLFQLLKYFSGPFIPVGTVIIPGILTTLLILLPFYDRNWSRKINRRPVAAVSMTGAMLVIIYLTWGGLGFPTPSFNTASQTAAPPPSSGSGGTTQVASISPAVSTIFQAHCAACHISQQLGGLNLSNYAGLVKGGNIVAGSVIVPGNHTKSVLWQIIQSKGPYPGGNQMPLGGPYLSSTDVSTIASWIDGLKSSTTSSSSTGSSSSGTVAQVSFKTNVASIFQAHCAACHIAAASGGLNLGNYNGLVKGGNVVPGSVIKAGDPANSILYKIVAPSGPYPGGAQMPLGGPALSATDVATISTWIKQGAKNN